MKNHRRLLEDCFGADRPGVYYTTISTRLLADEIAYIVRDCGAKVLVVSAELDALAAALPPLLPAGLCCFSAGNPAAGLESWDAAVDDARNEIPGSSRTPATPDGRQEPPTGPIWLTAEQHIPVVWPRTSGVRRTAARRPLRGKPARSTAESWLLVRLCCVPLQAIVQSSCWGLSSVFRMPQVDSRVPRLGARRRK